MYCLNWYDYSARHYDPAIVCFSSIDSMAEKYYSISPYAYVNNNPLKYIDPTGMWYDDYFNRKGEYLGTDNDLNSSKVRVMDDKTWAANKTNEGIIDHQIGVANSVLHTKSGITTDASLAIFEHYNDTGAKLKAESGNFLMQHNLSLGGNEVLGENISVNISNAKNSGVADNIFEIKNTFVHEGKHKSDARLFGGRVFSKMSKQVLENRAISAQVQHSSWDKTSSYYKGQVNIYANKFQTIVPGANHNFLKTPISAPLKIR